MRRCIGTIYLSEDNEENLMDYYYNNHCKTISQALDQVFFHYDVLIKQEEKHKEDMKKLKEQLNVLNTVLIQYRKQILKQDDTLLLTTTTTSTSSSCGGNGI